MFLNHRAPIRAYADRLVCNPGYNRATIHFDAVNPPDSWIVELVVHIAGFHHNGPPIRHNPTTHSVEGETGKAESSIAARLVEIMRAFTSRVPGGLGIATVLALTVFSAVCGASSVTGTER